MNRPDDPESVMAHANLYKGGTALIILGGDSARNWRDLKEEIKPDVILGANGVVLEIPDLDVHMCAENMTLTYKRAKLGDLNAQRMMRMVESTTAKVRLLSHRSWGLIEDKTNAICIRRRGWEMDEMPASYSFREYGEGYHSGWLLKHKHAGVPVHVGTVGLHLIHHAGILGCSKIHTIGFDLCFRDPDHHHFYEWPPYRQDRFRNQSMFIEYKGFATQWVWVECAANLKMLDPYFKRDGMQWSDHSDGLLSIIQGEDVKTYA